MTACDSPNWDGSHDYQVFQNKENFRVHKCGGWDYTKNLEKGIDYTVLARPGSRIVKLKSLCIGA